MNSDHKHIFSIRHDGGGQLEGIFMGFEKVEGPLYCQFTIASGEVLVYANAWLYVQLRLIPVGSLVRITTGRDLNDDLMRGSEADYVVELVESGGFDWESQDGILDRLHRVIA